MACDLAPSPQSGITVQLCGDAHLSNFGLFGSPERQLVFDINDFDETLPGPWEWDVKRLAASFEVAGRDLGFAASDRRDIVMAGVRKYRERMREAARMSTLDAWYSHLNVDEVTAWLSEEVRSVWGRRMRRGPSALWPRRAPATASGCCPSAPGRWVASCGSCATRR
jgi:uncharacterized protein (DUF2252 family)